MFSNIQAGRPTQQARTLIIFLYGLFLKVPQVAAGDVQVLRGPETHVRQQLQGGGRISQLRVREMSHPVQGQQKVHPHLPHPRQNAARTHASNSTAQKV